MNVVLTGWITTSWLKRQLYSTYLGGKEFDEPLGFAMDRLGNAYAIGRTNSSDYPVTEGAFQAKFAGPSFAGIGGDAFVTKLILGDPHVSDVSISGKTMFVSGFNFDDDSVLIVNGDDQKTSNDKASPRTLLIGKKAGKRIKPGKSGTVQVRASDGTLSNLFTFARPE